MFDGVQLFARAFKQLSDSVKGEMKRLPCNGSENWEHGISLSNFIRSVRSYEDQIMYSLRLCHNIFIFLHFFLHLLFCLQTEMRGLTGLVKFDTSGFRSDFQLDILNLGWNGISKIGTWNSTTNIDWIPESSSIDPNAGLSLRNMTFRVLISLVCIKMFKPSPS